MPKKTYSVDYHVEGLTKKRAYDLIIALHNQFSKILPEVKMYKKGSYKYAVKNDKTGKESWYWLDDV